MVTELGSSLCCMHLSIVQLTLCAMKLWWHCSSCYQLCWFGRNLEHWYEKCFDFFFSLCIGCSLVKNLYALSTHQHSWASEGKSLVLIVVVDALQLKMSVFLLRNTPIISTLASCPRCSIMSLCEPPLLRHLELQMLWSLLPLDVLGCTYSWLHQEREWALYLLDLGCS